MSTTKAKIETVDDLLADLEATEDPRTTTRTYIGLVRRLATGKRAKSDTATAVGEILAQAGKTAADLREDMKIEGKRGRLRVLVDDLPARRETAHKTAAALTAAKDELKAGTKALDEAVRLAYVDDRAANSALHQARAAETKLAALVVLELPPCDKARLTEIMKERNRLGLEHGKLRAKAHSAAVTASQWRESAKRGSTNQVNPGGGRWTQEALDEMAERATAYETRARENLERLEAQLAALDAEAAEINGSAS
jgi:hypothetical protein